MPQPSVLGRPLAALAENLQEPGTAEGFFVDDLLSLARRHLKSFLEISLERELTAYLGCGSHVRSADRQDYRNGFYTRDLATGFGLLQELRIPRSRRGGFQPSLFQRYERRKKDVEQFIQSLFFAGVSTRAVGEVLELLWGYAPSASTVSAVVAQLDAEVKAFHQRPLDDHYVYLFLDGLTVTLRELPAAKKRLVFVAYGITRDGRRVLLDYYLAASESSTEWERFLNKLQQRGLRGKHLKLITTDGGSGVCKAVPLAYDEIPHQLCWAHKLRNVAKHLKKSQERACLAQAQEIYRAENRKAARAAWKRWKESWEVEAPTAVACLAADLEALCTFLDCPAEHHRQIRTTNYIERVIRELRRRTRPMGSFAEKSSCDRLFYGVVKRINRNWSRKTLPGFTQQT